jgi:hypothetical protein
MSAFDTFWQQPNKAVRNARILFGILTLGFGIAAITYGLLPGTVVSQFQLWDRLLGGTTEYPELQNRIWISLAAANVATLSLMSYLLFTDMVKHQSVHLPLLFMKCTSAALFVYWFALTPAARSLLVAATSDFATGWAVWYFPKQAYASLGKK